MISFDGFRHDYVSRFKPPNFEKLIAKGATAEALIPSFPSKTYPNHYTLITGLYPGNHGLVDNHFHDLEQGKHYKLGDRKLVEDPSFYGGKPLWQLVQDHGMKSASFFWVGSEAPVHGRFPDYYFIYNDSISNQRRIDQVIEWFQLPGDKRPNFVSLYFSMVDTEGHYSGPDSEKLKNVVQQADRLLGQIMNRIRKLPLPINLIVVSDHGMYELKKGQDNQIILGELINLGDTTMLFANNSTHVHLYTRDKDKLYQELKVKENNFTVYKRGEFPSQWHYDHPRTGDILLIAKPGYEFKTSRNFFGKKSMDYSTYGVHGYDPYVCPEMWGIFYAMGPNIIPGKQLKRFENIHVYPMVAKILDLTLPVIDGKAEVTESIYRK